MFEKFLNSSNEIYDTELLVFILLLLNISKY